MIDVIIPIYKGLDQTRRCVESVLDSRQTAGFEVVVVDDASPDPDIARYLGGLAERGRITLLRNASNLGFVQSVNRGMALHAARDVVLLNSDTEVANDWLDRLYRTAYAHADIGTVTPFSNNATICTYPFEGWAGGLPGTLGLAALDGLFAATNDARTVNLPTAVGFCMYIRRACLDQLGLFDAQRFGRGYGEENDFCLRAAAAGWRSVLAGDVFVFHEGGVSFSEERDALTVNAGKALLEIYPEYMRMVREFITGDPALALRAAVDSARVALRTEELSHVLAERIEERKLLKARLTEAANYAEQLALVEKLLTERDTEIARLRSGLSHAEALAFERAQELETVHKSWLWKLRLALVRIKHRGRPKTPA